MKMFNRNFFAYIALPLFALSIGCQTGKAADKSDDIPYDQLQQLAKVYALIKEEYVEPMDGKEILQSAIEGMLNNLDPHSSYLDKDDYADMKEVSDGEFSGLGIEIGPNEDDGFVKVISPIEGTPAAKAGILPGDLILKIDGKSTDAMSVESVIKQLRGDAGSKVVLTIQHPNAKQFQDITLTRARVKVNSVRSKMLADDIAYIRITQFQNNTGSSLIDELNKLNKADTHIKGLVLDLRNNPGGLLTEAIGTAGAFLRHNELVVTTRGRVPDATEQYYVSPAEYARGQEDYLKNLPKWSREVPMVVLINVGSASAAEIVAGALQDHHRATLMGNRSFGKGSVQVVIPLDDDTGLKLTTSRYYTPLGRSIQATGIKPDLMVSDTQEGNIFSFPREADLQHHLRNDQTNKEEKGNDSQAEKAKLIKAKMYDFGSSNDFQVQQAVNHLLKKPVVIETSKDAQALKNEKSTDTDSKTDSSSSTDKEQKKSENQVLEKNLDKATKPNEVEKSDQQAPNKQSPALEKKQSLNKSSIIYADSRIDASVMSQEASHG